MSIRRRRRRRIIRIPGIGGAAGGGAAAASAYVDEVLADSPIAYWKMDESAGASSLADSSGAGLDMVDVRGSPTFEEPQVGGGGTSILFDPSTEDHFHRGLSNEFKVDPITLEILVAIPSPKPSAITEFIVLAPRESESDGRGVKLAYQPSNDRWFVGKGTSAVGFEFHFAPTGAVVAGTSYHLVAHVGASRVAIYENATQVYEDATTTDALEWTNGALGQFPNPEQAYIGAKRSNTDLSPEPDTIGDSEFMEGRLQHAAVYSGELAEARIQDHFDETGL